MLNPTPIQTTPANIQGSPYVPAKPISSIGTEFQLNEAQAARPAPEQTPILGKGIATTMQTAEAGSKEVADAKQIVKAQKFEDVLNKGLPLAVEMYKTAKGLGITVPDPSIYYAAGPDKAAAWLTDTAQKIAGANAANALSGPNPDLTAAAAATLRSPNPKETAPTLGVVSDLEKTQASTQVALLKQENETSKDAKLNEKNTASNVAEYNTATKDLRPAVQNLNALNAAFKNTFKGGNLSGPNPDVNDNGIPFDISNPKNTPTPTAPDRGILDLNKADLEGSKFNNLLLAFRTAFQEAGSTGDQQSAVVNAIKGLAIAFVPKLAEKLLSNPAELEALKIAKAVQGNEALMKQLSDPDIQSMLIPLSGLINSSLKATSGTAVSANEFVRKMAEFGSGTISSPGGLVLSLRNLTSAIAKDANIYDKQLTPDAKDKLSGDALSSSLGWTQDPSSDISDYNPAVWRNYVSGLVGKDKPTSNSIPTTTKRF